MVYLTLGDMFNDGLEVSLLRLTFNNTENSTWELEDGRQVPHLLPIKFEFTYIGKENPTMTSKHYDNISDSFSFEEKGEDEN